MPEAPLAEQRPVLTRLARRPTERALGYWADRRVQRAAILLLGLLVGISVGWATAPASPRTAIVSDSWRPPPGGYLALVPVGRYATLPDDARAVAKVHRSSWENRPDNIDPNYTVPKSFQLRATDVLMRAYDPRWNRYILARVSGAFTGTTDEIIQWAAAKWGLPDEMLRAVAVMESDWHQRKTGDFTTDPDRCLPGYPQPPCPLSFGIVGVRSNSWPGSFPAIRDSTAADLDLLGAWLRGCFEGWVWWLRDHGNTSNGRYQGGDLWGCVGAWFSGDWYDGSRSGPGAQGYIVRARHWYADKPWLRAGY